MNELRAQMKQQKRLLQQLQRGELPEDADGAAVFGVMFASLLAPDLANVAAAQTAAGERLAAAAGQ